MKTSPKITTLFYAVSNYSNDNYLLDIDAAFESYSQEYECVTELLNRTEIAPPPQLIQRIVEHAKELVK